MKQQADNPEAYIAQLPPDRQAPMKRLRETIKAALPASLVETMSYGMISYGIPHSLYPAGYRANPSEPVPFISIASQKRHIALYHMGLYMSAELTAWFRDAYPRHARTKLDMAKSCIRFKKMDDIPYDLIDELCAKVTVEAYLAAYVASRGKAGGHDSSQTSG
jgi:uncharacterized protein YdhG (YjbR/CyaY superfamily)